MRARSGRIVGLLLVLGLLAGCTGDDEPDPHQGPSPEATAEALATGLASGDLTRVAFDAETAEGAQAAYDAVLAGMGERTATVQVAGVEEGSEEGTAEATPVSYTHLTLPTNREV